MIILQLTLVMYAIVGQVLSNDVDIVIIGAGASGFGAASRLLEKGLTNLTVLEARNRIGGRVNTVEFGNLSLACIKCSADKEDKVFSG